MPSMPSAAAPLWISIAIGTFVDSSPAVAEGAVFVGSQNGKVYALDANTGAVLWSTLIGGSSSMEASPAVAGGIVYVGSPDDHLYALNAKTGVSCGRRPPAEP